MRKSWLALLMALSLGAGSAGTYGVLKWMTVEEEAGMPREEERAKDREESLTKIDRAFDLIKNSYVEPVDDEELIEGAIRGMLSALDDPYSVYMDKETVEQFNESLDSTFEGIGAEVSKINGKIIIVSPFKDSPAEKAGLRPNDEILSIDGESVEGLDLHLATMKIRGKKGTKVQLEIRRQGVDSPIKVNITRDEIPQITVYGEVKKKAGNEFGYIEITSFSKETAAEFKKKLKELEKKGISGLIIDVRGNPGGLLASVEDILKEFIPKDKPYVQIEQRDGERLRYFSNLDKGKDYPIVILVDKGSASASEILAGAMKEGGNSILVGEKTFGKGTVQQAVPMGDGSNIKLTLFKWLTPDGNWINGKGIEPDVEISQPPIFHIPPLQLENELERDLNNDQVKSVQHILQGLGFEPGRTDGYFDRGTENAVKAFQNHKGLKPTGKINEKTAAALEEAAAEERKKEQNDLQLQTALHYLVTVTERGNRPKIR